MLYLKASEYGIRDLYFQAQHGISVLGRQFVIDEWLPNNSTELAKRKCRQYLESNIVCILVEFSDRFGIYLDLDDNIDVSVTCEKVTLNLDNNKPASRQKRPSRSSLLPAPRQLPSQPARSSQPKAVNLPEARTKVETLRETSSDLMSFADLSTLVEKLAVNMDIQSERQFRHLISHQLILDRRIALQNLKQAFSECIGPIAGLIYQDIMSEIGSIETIEDFWHFFEALTAEIDEPDYQEQFRARASQKIVPESREALKIVRESLQASVGPIADMIYQDVIEE